MPRFSLKVVLVGIAIPLLAFLTYWHFIIAEKTIDEIVPNIISDIVFAIFIVLFIEYANEKDREQRNRSRRRAGALAVHKYFQNIHSIINELVRDGVKSSGAITVPATETVRQRAQALHVKDSVAVQQFDLDPIPYAAYFVAAFTGNSTANVYPARSSRAYVAHCANEIDTLYGEVFNLDGGLMPDEVVDALTKLKNSSPFIYLRHLDSIPSSRFGYWPESELREIGTHLETLQAYFGKLQNLEAFSYRKSVSEIVKNALNSNQKSS